MKNIFKIAIGVGIVATTGLLIKKFVDHEVEEEDESPIEEEEAVATEEMDLLDDMRDRNEKLIADLEKHIEDQELREELNKIHQENLADIERIAKSHDPFERMEIMNQIYERYKNFKEGLEDTPEEYMGSAGYFARNLWILTYGTLSKDENE